VTNGKYVEVLDKVREGTRLISVKDSEWLSNAESQLLVSWGRKRRKIDVFSYGRQLQYWVGYCICNEGVFRLTRENLLASGHGGRNGILNERQDTVYTFHVMLGFTNDTHTVVNKKKLFLFKPF